MVLSVAGSGAGFASGKDSERAFEPFFTTKAFGVGLGLPICRAVVENHGGNLALVSTGRQGSVFELSLPLDRQTGPLITTGTA